MKENRMATRQDIEHLVQCWRRGRAFLTAIELGVFTHLDEFRTAEQVAENVGASPRHLERLLNVLVSMGFIEKEGGRFRNLQIASTYLVPGKPEYLLSLAHAADLWKSWSRLTDVIREGKPARMLGPPPPPVRSTENFIAAMHQFASSRAPHVFDRIDLDGVASYLDLGGGSGAMALELLRRKPSVKVTIFDLPEVISLARRYVGESVEDASVEFMEGDFTKDDIGSGYDMIMMSQIIHSLSEKQAADLVKKAAAALAAGGRLVVHDFIVDRDECSPPWAVLFALNMLVNTTDGDTYTADEVESWAAVAGLSPAGRFSTPANSDVMVFKKGG